jgi:hypothetical protein
MTALLSAGASLSEQNESGGRSQAAKTVSADSITAANLLHDKLRRAARLPPRPLTGDMIRVAFEGAMVPTQTSLIVVRESNGAWSAEEISSDKGDVPERWTIRDADAQHLDALASDPSLIERSRTAICVDGWDGMIEVSWRGQLKRMSVVCNVEGPARRMLDILEAAEPDENR